MSQTDRIRQGIIETAEALGVNPADIATIISFETGGTFDPRQPGPTTKWGRHRGLIQFGEPQARQHGVDWNNPIESQLGPEGAIVSYMRGAGVQPGMGLLDLYSAVNAGYVGRYNASDTAAGGTWGTVRDKVQYQMHGHMQKAEQLLGGEFQVTQLSGTPSGRPSGRPAQSGNPPTGGGQLMSQIDRAQRKIQDMTDSPAENMDDDRLARVLEFADGHSRGLGRLGLSTSQRLQELKVLESTVDPNMPLHTY